MKAIVRALLVATLTALICVLHSSSASAACSHGFGIGEQRVSCLSSGTELRDIMTSSAGAGDVPGGGVVLAR